MSSNQQPGQAPAFPGATPPAGKPAKPWFKKWWVWVLGILLLVGIGNALGNKGDSTTAGPAAKPAVSVPGAAGSAPASAPAKEEPKQEAPKKERLTLDDGWKLDRSNQFALFVQGYVSNNSDKPVNTYGQITFDALDKAGANVGSCFANTNTIDANGKWKFKAMCTGDVKDIATVRFKDITGF